MTPTKGTIAAAVVAGVLALAKLWLQNRSNKELREAEARARKELADQQAAAAERAARHAREAAERAEERAQKEALIASLQKQTEETLTILKTELKVQQDTSSRAFELLDRNTQATQKLAEAVASQAQDLRTLTNTVAELKGGAGCRAGSNGRAS